MDQETFNALVFMFFGLGFFIFVTFFVTRNANADRDARVMELREFGAIETDPQRRRTLFRRP